MCLHRTGFRRPDFHHFHVLAEASTQSTLFQGKTLHLVQGDTAISGLAEAIPEGGGEFDAAIRPS